MTNGEVLYLIESAVQTAISSLGNVPLEDREWADIKISQYEEALQAVRDQRAVVR